MKRKQQSQQQLENENAALASRNAELEAQLSALSFHETAQRERLNYFKQIFFNSLNGIALHEIITDDQGNPIDYIFLEVNPDFEALTHLNAEAIIGKRVTEVLPGIEKESFIAVYGAVALSGKPARIEQYAAGLDTYFDIVVFSPRKSQFVTIFTDISARKRAELELLDHHQQLEEKVRARTADLESLLLMITHDLLAPLRNIVGFGQVLRDDHGWCLDENGKLFLERLIAIALQMTKHITDILDYNRLCVTSAALESVDLNALIDTTLKDIGVGGPASGAEITVRRPLPVVLGNRTLLYHVVANLISNALKFVETGEKPRVVIWAEEVESLMRIWVEDNGIGIAPEYQEKVFRIFERLETQDKYPGSGVGLAVVKRSIEKLKGRLGVESAPGQGSKFWFELKQAEANGSGDRA